MAGLSTKINERVNEAKLDMKVKDNVQLGIEAQALASKRIRLME